MYLEKKSENKQNLSIINLQLMQIWTSRANPQFYSDYQLNGMHHRLAPGTIRHTLRRSRLCTARQGLTLTDSWLGILRGIESLITHNRNYRRTRPPHKALKQDERLPPLLPSERIGQVPLKLKEEQGNQRHSLREQGWGVVWGLYLVG